MPNDIAQKNPGIAPIAEPAAVDLSHVDSFNDISFKFVPLNAAPV